MSQTKKVPKISLAPRKASIELISLSSLSGGVGKTTLAAALAVAKLQAGYHSVLVVDADLTGLGHLKTLYRFDKQDNKHHTFFQVVTDPDVEYDPSCLCSVDWPWKVRDGLKECTYQLLPNLPPREPFPSNLREVTLSSYYTGIATARLGAFLKHFVYEELDALGQIDNPPTKLCVIVDCSPFVTAMAEELFVWVTSLALKVKEPESARELLVRHLEGEDLLDPELPDNWTVDWSVRPLIVLHPDPYFRVTPGAARKPPTGDADDLLGPLLSDLRNLVTQRLKNEKASAVDWGVLLEQVIPSDPQLTGDLLLFNRVTPARQLTADASLVVQEDPTLAARPESKLVLPKLLEKIVEAIARQPIALSPPLQLLSRVLLEDGRKLHAVGTLSPEGMAHNVKVAVRDHSVKALALLDDLEGKLAGGVEAPVIERVRSARQWIVDHEKWSEAEVTERLQEVEAGSPMPGHIIEDNIQKYVEPISSLQFRLASEVASYEQGLKALAGDDLESCVARLVSGALGDSELEKLLSDNAFLFSYLDAFVALDKPGAEMATTRAGNLRVELIREVERSVAESIQQNVVNLSNNLPAELKQAPKKNEHALT